MSQNLNLLRQKYCRPATLSGKKTHYLFPLEKECEQGKALLAKTPTNAPSPSRVRSIWSPTDLSRRGYRCGTTGFAVFDLEGKHQLTFEITTDSVPTTAETKSLPAYIPFQKTQASVRKMNERRMKAERAVTRLSVILGIFPAFAYLFSHITVTAGAAVPYILVGGWILGAFLTYLLSLFCARPALPVEEARHHRRI